MEFPHPAKSILPHKIRIVSLSNIVPKQDADRFSGSLVGLAVGDALGASVEFRPHQYFVEHPVGDMEGGGTWGLKPGQWTDDTSMALCLASSLISKKGYDPYDQMVRYKWWYKHGYMSSTGNCFDIGNATRDSLEEFIYRQKSLTQHFRCKEDKLDTLSMDQIESIQKFDVNCSTDGVAGNGALMRLAPVPLFFYKYPDIAVEYAGRSARLTHGDKKAVDACRYYAALIVAAVSGKSKESLLSDSFYETHIKWFGSVELHPEILRVAKGSYKNPNGYDGGIRGKGYIVNALEAALWAFWSDDNSFKNGALNAVNLGDDTDTTAAIYGQLAGAFYGCEQIPDKWRKKLYAFDLLECVGQWLYYQGKQYNPTEKERKMISSEQSATKTSLSQHQPAQTSPLSIHLLDTDQSQTNLPIGRDSRRDRLDSREIIVNHNDADRIRTRYPSERQVSQRYLGNSGTPLNILRTNQSTTYQRPEEQPSTHYSYPHHTPIHQFHQTGNITGQTGQYMSAYNNAAGYGSSRGNVGNLDSYSGRIPTNSSTYSPYDTDIVTGNRRFETFSNIPTTYYPGGRQYNGLPTHRYPFP